MGKFYTQRFRDKWLFEPQFRDWLRKLEGDDYKCICRYCRCTLKAKYSDLKTHSKCSKHARAKERFLSGVLDSYDEDINWWETSSMIKEILKEEKEFEHDEIYMSDGGKNVMTTQMYTDVMPVREDECVVLGNFVAGEMRSVTGEKRQKFKKKILQVLLEFSYEEAVDFGDRSILIQEDIDEEIEEKHNQTILHEVNKPTITYSSY